MQGGSAHINYLLNSWTMQTKLGSAICYKSHIQIHCRIIASLAMSYIPIARILHNLCAWLHDLEAHKWRFHPGELWTWYNMYHNTTSFKEKIMKYWCGLVIFHECRKPERVIILKNFPFSQKEIWSSSSWRSIKEGTFVILQWHPTYSWRRVGGRAVMRKSSTVYQPRQK